MKVSRKDKIVKAVLEAAFPDYKGRKIEVIPTTSIRLVRTAWDDGGSKNHYVAVKRDMSKSELPFVEQWGNPYEGKEIMLDTESIIACHIIYCGSDLGVEIFAHPDLMPKMIEGAK